LESSDDRKNKHIDAVCYSAFRSCQNIKLITYNRHNALSNDCQYCDTIKSLQYKDDSDTNVYNNNNNNIHICIAPYGRNFRGAGPGSVLVGVRRGKRVSLGEEKCL